MYTARPFHPSAEEYQAVTDVFSADWPDVPATPSVWQHDDENWDPQYLFQRFVVEADQQIVAEGYYFEDSWSHVPGKYCFAYSMHPDHRGEPIQRVIYDFVVERLAARDPVPNQLWAYSREDRPIRNAFLLAEGFAVSMREPRSILDVAAFTHERFADVEEPVRRAGLVLMSLAEYQVLDSEWARKCWELRLEIDRDIPWPDPIQTKPFDEFLKSLDHPHFAAAGLFLAVDKHGATDPKLWQLVGMSQVGVDPHQQEKVYQWMTGVRRAYRRKGVATALKVRVINYVAASGVRFIETDNAEDNPMYGINLNLGFEPQPALLALRKQLYNGPATSRQQAVMS